MSVPAAQPAWPSRSSKAKTLKDANGVEPGWVEIIPRNRVTVQVRTWLLSAHTGEGDRGGGLDPEDHLKTPKGHSWTRKGLRGAPKDVGELQRPLESIKDHWRPPKTTGDSQ